MQAGASGNTPSPSLAPALLDLAWGLLTLAHSTLSRVQVLASTAAAVQPQLQQLAAAAEVGQLAAAQQQVAAIGTELLSSADVSKQQRLGLRAALAAAAALDALQRAAAVEGLAAVAVLRLAEVRQAGFLPVGTMHLAVALLHWFACVHTLLQALCLPQFCTLVY